MFVSRSDVSFLDSIHLDSCVTGANAMSSSLVGNGAASGFERTNLSWVGAGGMPGNIGFHSVAGASVSTSATRIGPVRRSRYCASDVRQVSAACCRSASVIVTCISFSASANVAGVTAGPEPAPVPNVGGAPGVVGGDAVDNGGEAGAVSLLHALAATRNPSGARI